MVLSYTGKEWDRNWRTVPSNVSLNIPLLLGTYCPTYRLVHWTYGEKFITYLESFQERTKLLARNEGRSWRTVPSNVSLNIPLLLGTYFHHLKTKQAQVLKFYSFFFSVYKLKPSKGATFFWNKMQTSTSYNVLIYVWDPCTYIFLRVVLLLNY